ncbi:unnamed protein product, partial [Ixodes hexagonus]
VAGQPKVGTLVFIDLESTGLPSMMAKYKVNITEISLVAVERANFKEPLRYVNKLTFCVRPRHTITEGASRITCLDNEQLEKSPPFEDVAPVVEHFLHTLPQPVCLLAHNGDGFDFPLLHSELQRCPGVDFAPFFCCDTLPAFRKILNSPDLQERIELTKLKELTPDFWEAFDECDMLDDDTLRLSPTEVTPTKSKTVPTNAAPQKRRAVVDRRMQPEPQKSARRSLFPEGTQRTTMSAPAQNGARNGGRQSFSLGNVYERLFGRPIQSAHNAEADCLALAEICCHLRGPVLEYIDAHCRSVVQVTPMW